jgi:hypothetical protein
VVGTLTVVEDMTFLTSFLDQYKDSNSSVLNTVDPITHITTTLGKLVGTLQARDDVPQSINDLIAFLGGQQ